MEKGKIKITVKERPDRPGTWQVTVGAGSGDRRRPQFRSKEDAEKHAEKLRRLARTGGLDVESATVKAAIKGFLKAQEEKELLPKTLSHNREMLMPLFEVFGGDTLAEELANEAAIKRYQKLRRSKVGKCTVRHNMCVLRQLLRWAHAQQ